MAMIDEAALDEKLAWLESARDWSPRLVAKLEALLVAPDEQAVLRMNPLAFARERGVEPAESLDLFLHAARIGLVTMDWHLLCPSCGAAVQSFASLRGVHSTIFCALCDLRSVANLDDYIQVSFTVAPTVRRLAFHDLESLSAEDYFYQLRLTREMHFGNLDGPRLCDLMPRFMNILTWLQPGTRTVFAFETSGEGQFAAAELQAHSGTVVQVRNDADAAELAIRIGETDVTASCNAVRPGRIEGTVENLRAGPVVFAIAFHSAEELAGGLPPTTLAPIVTGAMLLTNPTFRRLFRTETLDRQEGIGVRDVTVLFTDLKGSTALYEKIGDLEAFTLVQQHFERLAAVVHAHNGAIVKTIGDAVMAAFQRPADAVRAAVQMQAQIEGFNRERGSREVVLKIGIHRGPSIAVTLNESLDYFGHTVNVAARVQGLADADEIYVTDEVYQADEVAPLLPHVDSRDAELRGIQQPVRVHRAREFTA
jgi:class 3 adenylate cyclase